MFFTKKEGKQAQSMPDFQDFLDRKLKSLNAKDIPKKTDKVLEILQSVFKDSDDFNVREIHIPSGQTVYIYYISGLVNVQLLHTTIVEPFVERNEKANKTAVKYVKDVIFSASVQEEISNWKDLLQDCLNGYIICHVDGLKPATVELVSIDKRSLSEPGTEYQVYGPKAGFIENIKTNVSMMRSFIRDPRLKIKDFTVGTLSHTPVSMLYLDEYVDPELRDQVIERIHKVNIDNLVNGNQLEHNLVDFPMSLFPQMRKTERPDYCSYALSQGKIIILVDNSTFALVIPTTLIEFYETSEDHYYKVWTRVFMRVLRFVSLFIAAIFPSIYVSFVAFHPELIPTTLALTLLDSRSQIPFPATVEAFLLMFALDVLIEATMRLPSVVGQTIGIVGAIVLGSAAVEAGIVSNVLVIVISFTAISSFTVPSWEIAQTWRTVRYLLLFLSSFFGLYGLMLGVCLITIHLCHIHSYSKPYYSPLSPLNPKELINVFFRFIPRKNRN